jgi:uncharacterized protein YjgD (DUF1641 family)
MNRIWMLALPWIIIACSGNPNEGAIKEVEDVLAVINEADSSIKSIDVERLKPYIDTINFDVKFVQQEFADTMSLQVATQVDAYSRLVRSIQKFEKAYNDQLKDIEYSKHQLQNLKADLSSNTIDSSGFSLYFPAEKDAVDRLAENNMNIISWYESIEKGFVKHRRPVDSLIVEIKKKTGY